MNASRRTRPLRRTIVPPAAAASAGAQRKMLADWAKLIGEQIAGHEPSRVDVTAPTTPIDDPVHRALTPRLQQTLALLLAGDGEKQVAHKLGISRHTVHTYVKQLYTRYAVSSRAELLARFVQTPPSSSG